MSRCLVLLNISKQRLCCTTSPLESGSMGCRLGKKKYSCARQSPSDVFSDEAQKQNVEAVFARRLSLRDDFNIKRKSAHSEEELKLLHKPRPYFSEEDKKAVITSWQNVERDLHNVGVQVFIGLFESCPNAQELFDVESMSSKESIPNSLRFKRHILLMMNLIEKALARINHREQFEHLLHDLGAKHAEYGIIATDLDLMVPYFVAYLRGSVSEMWPPEVEIAWMNFMGVLISIMKEAF